MVSFTDDDVNNKKFFSLFLMKNLSSFNLFHFIIPILIIFKNLKLQFKYVTKYPEIYYLLRIIHKNGIRKTKVFYIWFP